MLEMGTSGLMSGEGKRGGAQASVPSPFLDSTPAARLWQNASHNSGIEIPRRLKPRPTSFQDQPVANAWLGLQVLRPSRVDLQLAPKLGDINSQILRLIDMIRSPNLVQELALREHFARMLNEHLQ